MDGLHRRTNGVWSPWPVAPGVTMAMLPMPDGSLWVGSGRGLFHSDAAGVRQVSERPVNCLAHVGDRILAGTTAGIVTVTTDGYSAWPPAANLRESVQALFVARDGALWVGTECRAIRIDATALLATAAVGTAPPLPPDVGQTCRTFLEDREGNLWIGHTERGATCVGRAELFRYDGANGLPPRNLVAVLDGGKGNLLLGTHQGLLYGPPQSLRPLPAAAAFGWIRGMHRAPDGAVWFGCRDGLARLAADLATAELVIPRRDQPDATRAMVTMADGTLWLGGDGGLARRDGDRLQWPDRVAALRGKLVRTVATGPDQALWVGGPFGVARLPHGDGPLRIWRSGSDLPWGEVRAILPESPTRAWIASYGGGLICIDGDRCTAVDERHGLHDQSVCTMVALHESLVLATNRGVCLVARRDLETIAAGTATSLGCRSLRCEGDGLAECNGGMQPCAERIGDRVYVCGIDALYEFDPARLSPVDRDPLLHLDALHFGDRAAGPGLDHTVPAGIRSATIRLGCSALHDHDRLRYRWRLLGRDAAFTPPGFDPVVRIANLPAGELWFEAEAIDIDGRHSSTPLRLRLVVPPRLWESAPFWFAAAFGTTALAVMLLRLGASRASRRAAALQGMVEARTAELRAAHQTLEARVAERTADLRTALERQATEQAERQRLERQLLQLQRMESLGQLAGGIAHDFNNLLTVTAGSGQLLDDHVTSAEGKELCRSIAQACERGRRLTQHLLAVASRQLVTAEQLDLDRVIQDLLPVLRSLLGDTIRLEFRRSAGGAEVRAAITQIEQVLLNLAANARDAMPQGGEVTIEVTVADHRVWLLVRDTGCGMAAEVVERVFEPFFSTKRQGSGRGLGLATVYGIVKQLAGQIRIDSAIGKGTTVRIDLPAAARSEPPPPGTRPPVQTAPERLHGTVLLIEDEPDVRGVLRRLLEDLGLRVVTAGDGPAGVATLAATPAVDLVVSDVLMPGLHGPALVRTLREVRPGLPIVFLTGYLDGRITHQELAALGLVVLPKPVDRHQLAAALQQHLARPTGG